MKSIIEALSGKKTYLAGIGTVLVALASLLGIGIPGVEAVDKGTAIQMLTTAIMAIFLRQGVAKSGATKP